jgi:hypothetical protein
MDSDNDKTTKKMTKIGKTNDKEHKKHDRLYKKFLSFRRFVVRFEQIATSTVIMRVFFFPLANGRSAPSDRERKMKMWH